MKIKKVNVAGGVIYSEGDNGEYKILVIQRAEKDHWPHYWEFPRGKCDAGPNESLIHCLKREVKEEAGIDVIPEKFIDKFSYTADEGKRLSTQHNFLCKMKDPNQKIKLSFEHQDFGYIMTPSQGELLLLPEMKKTIIKAFEMLDPEKNSTTQPEHALTKPDVIEEIQIMEEYLNYLQEDNTHINIMSTYVKDSTNKFNQCLKKLSQHPIFSKKRKLLKAICKQKQDFYEIQQLKSRIGMCNKSTNPEKCRIWVKHLIQNLLKSSNINQKTIDKLKKGFSS